MRVTWMPTLLLGGVGLCLPACNGCNVETVDDTPGTLRGTACQQISGRPTIGAKVTVTAKKGTVLTATTDTLGKFEMLNVPPGEADVLVEGEGAPHTVADPKPLIKSKLMSEWLDPACIDPTTLVGKGCITGQVCNRHTGTTVSDAVVTVVLSNGNYTGPATDLETTTNAQGIFQKCGIPAGSHTVTVRAVGFQRAYPATITEGQTTEVVAAPTCNPFNPMDYCRVTGRVCTSETPVGWLPDARVTAQLLNPDGTLASPAVHEAQDEYTDADGRYELFLQPQGKWKVQVQKGNFLSQTTVDCVVNEVKDIPEGTQCVSASQCRFLVAQGIFDRVESVLARVGVPANRIDVVNGNPPNLNDDWAFQAFGTATSLDGYCGVFFNCGIDESAFAGPRQNPVVLDHLRAFVERGGTIYASDQSYDVVEALYPGKVDWFRNDALASDAEYGLPGEITANVTEDGLRTYLQSTQPGQNSVTIKFNYQSWAIMQTLDPDVQVYLRAPVQACADGEACGSSVTLPDTPLTVRYPVGSQGGQVIFTSFHVEAMSVDDGGAGMILSTPDTDRVMRFLMTL